MLTVLLTILKVIGITLLVILGLVLLIVLIVLFVPLRYRAVIDRPEAEEGAKMTDGLSADVRVTYLLHFISFRLRYADGALSKALRVLGIDLLSKKKKDDGKKKKKKKKPKAPKKGPERPLSEIAGMKKTGGEAPAGSAPDSAAAKDGGTVKDAGQGKEKLPGHKVGKRKKEDVGLKADETVSLPKAEIPGEEEIRTYIEKEDGGISVSGRIWYALEKIFRLFRILWEKLAGFRKKVSDAIPKIVRMLDLIEDERFWDALRKALKEVGVILGGLLPKKRKGTIRYGTGDPAKTGQAMGYLAWVMPVIGTNKVAFVPDFERKTIEGHVELAGRVLVISILAAGVRILLNKNVKFVIRYLKKKEG